MMFNPKKAITVLALAGLAFASTAANAATTYTAGDLLVGFRQTGAGASTNSLVIDIGQASLYLNAAGNLNPILGNAGLDADLAAEFGANWYTDGSVKWGIIGAIGASAVGSQPADTLFASMKETSGVNADGYGRYDSGTQATPSNGVQNLGATYAGKTITGNVALVQANATANTWGNKVGTGFGGGSIFGSTLEGVLSSTSKLDLSRSTPDDLQFADGTLKGTIAGTFSLSSTGGLTFTPNVAAAPEPGRAAFMALGLGAFVLRRRRSARVAA
ncbi:PEP-CTERM sorting domain-containing protein [Prosthecobacter sp.]|uniref:PEP-CTERM sorting domain-containing protein n=1 Tax=Prosthecobacter sp. TaxID=1965333 RepID=UPI00378306D0